MSDDDEGWTANPYVYEESSSRASLVLDSSGEPFMLEKKKQPIGFRLKKGKTNV